MAEEQPCDVQQEERRLFGVDHCEAGRSLIVAWNLPQFLEVTANHHELSQGQGEIEVPALVGLSCALSETIGFEVVRSSIRRSYCEIIARLASEIQHRFPAEEVELSRRITDKVNSLEAI